MQKYSKYLNGQNKEIEKICSSYRVESTKKLWDLIMNAMKKNSEKIRLKVKASDVYFENNWSNKVNLDEVDFDIHDFVLFSDCSFETLESYEKIIFNNWIPLPKLANIKNKHGYFGNAFYKKNQNKVTIIIAHHSGTIVNNWSNI